ncbi:MAG: hypothetical protein H0X34_06695 [Chthoniobacterales bacterium]|nr:hypothetical protein [Chthoniobacterales bacterium]
MKSKTEIAVIVETPNLAVSAGPLGTVLGIQLAAVFQYLLAGFASQVALSAWLDSTPRGKTKVNENVTTKPNFVRPFIHRRV